jgi:hypothetical protein
MKGYLFLLLAFISAFSSCKNAQTEESTLSAQAIVDSAISKSGGVNYENLKVAFDFRNKSYQLERESGKFTYQRAFTDSSENRFVDRLWNAGFERTINDSVVSLSEKKANAYSNSINSVMYFALLPYGLNDSAVEKEVLPTVSIKNINYHKIKVTFKQEGGGEDFDDVFIYWFRKENFQLDYFAYKYHTDGGGIRFREAYGRSEFGGVSFANYVNYKPKSQEIDFFGIDALFENGELMEVSRIENEGFREAI